MDEDRPPITAADDEPIGDRPGPEVRPEGTRLAERILLVGWDAADWKMIDPLLGAGHMPNLQKLIDKGVRGNVASLVPMLSPMLWTSIATGKTADQHNILGFAEPDGTTGKVRPVTSTSRTCRAFWNILARQDLRCAVLNWFASHPAENIDNGVVVTDRYARPVASLSEPWPHVPGSVYPQEYATQLDGLRIHPASITAEQLGAFLPSLHTIDLKAEKEPHALAHMLAHCASIQAATTWLMMETEWDVVAVYFDEIDRVGHEFMEFHPPKMPHVTDEQFERYRDVMTACYRFHDMMLGRLMELAGDETTFILVSDHGFHSDELRPEGSGKIHEGRPVAWHRPYGVLVISGPGVRAGERLYGASLLDITPTILALLGLPVGDDMPGAPLVQIYEQPARIARVPTYEPDDGSPPHDAVAHEEDPWVVREMMVQLAALGYVEDDSMENVVKDRYRSLGQVHASQARFDEAIDCYRRALEIDPEDKGVRIAIAGARLATGELDECERIVDEVLGVDPADAPVANRYKAMIRFRRGDHDAALEYIRAAEKQAGESSSLQTLVGEVYLARNEWSDARRAFETALELDPDNAEAHDGLGVALRHLDRRQDAVLTHMKSIALLHHRARTHFNLGIVLAELGRARWSAHAFRQALRINPEMHGAHAALARLYEKALDRPYLAEQHRTRARQIAARANAGEAAP
jgi:predicted AlkP superfamily phosphohydrolase/phosphomutase/tetratricopeptide (TPR) repeat protein